MLKIYLCNPYTHSDHQVMEDRYLAACLKASQLVKDGHYVYSPIVHWHPVAKLHSLPREWEFWKRLDTEAIKMMDEVWILKLEGWHISVGVGREVLIAKELHKPFYFIDP